MRSRRNTPAIIRAVIPGVALLVGGAIAIWGSPDKTALAATAIGGAVGAMVPNERERDDRPAIAEPPRPANTEGSGHPDGYDPATGRYTGA